jgi:hypothetical protein
MAILIYWKYDNYVQDNVNGFGYAFNSNQSRLHSVTDIGEDVFVVSGIRKESGLEIYLMAHLIIKEKAYNPPDHKYGRYRIVADEDKSKYFSLDAEPITPLLPELTSINHFGEEHIDKYAQSFQTLRKLNGHDAQILKRFADSLPEHPKA